jgi:hypothetical protein
VAIINALDLNRYVFLCRACEAGTWPRGYTPASAALFAELEATNQRVLTIEITPSLEPALAGGAN